MSPKVAFATAIAVALLLSGCAPSSATPPTPHATPSPTASQPAFLTTPQTDVDLLPEGVASGMRVDPATTRYQGSWNGRQVFLGLKPSGSVCLVMTSPQESDRWTASCGDGNGVVTDELPDGTTARYLPIVTTATPEGWTRLSDYVFVM